MRTQEGAIETGNFQRPEDGTVLLAGLIDAFEEHCKTIRKPLGKTATNSLKRIREEHGAEPIGALTIDFWRKHALDRIKDGAASQTAAQDLLYISPLFATRREIASLLRRTRLEKRGGN